MIRRLTVAALCVAALALLIPIAASAARPLRFTITEFEPALRLHETLEGPCGAAVNSQGDLFVSDYYRSKIVAFDPSGEFLTQIAGVSPVDAPCGLAIDSAGVIYANLYHGGIAVLEPSGSTYTNRGVELDTHATGVAIDPVTGNLLVDERTAIGEYELPLAAGEAPLRTIGSLGDGYGLAVSGFAGTEGWIYAADAADATVKAFDPATSLTAPAEVIDGSGTPLGRFNDLTDAALLLDGTNGHLLVTDNVDGQLFEGPRAAVEEFDPAGTFLGALESLVVDGEPIGLAVDDSGDVYVTGGNSEKANVLAYGPFTPPPPARFAASAVGPTSTATVDAATPDSPPAPTALSSSGSKPVVATASTITQKGTLRVSVKGGISPKRLPRRGSAPVAVAVSGHLTTTDGSVPPQLRVLTIDINREGTFDVAGLPVCPLRRIQPASSARALSACRSSLVGQGRFSGETSLSGVPYQTQGRLLLFNGLRHGSPVIYGQIYSTRPFTSSYVVPFSVRFLRHGTFGTELRANLAAALGQRERLTGIEMVLSRRYTSAGEHRSVLSAGCPAPKGFPGAVFPLLRASFSFAGPSVSETLTGNCQAR